jgi:BioD-like phosphotransacetylase family protein
MKSLYVTSVERYSGKTAACLALGRYFLQMGLRVCYLKPLSLQPWRVSGKIADEDAAFVIEALGLKKKPWELSPVVLTPEFLRAHLQGQVEMDLMQKVQDAFDNACEGHNIMLLEGGGSLREGYVVGLPTPEVAAKFGSSALAVVKYRDDVRVIDDALTAKTRLGDSLLGVIINRVPEGAQEFVSQLATPFLEDQGITVFGMLPEVRALAALTVQEIIDVLDAEVLNETFDTEALVENLMVGAMTTDAALSRFRKQVNKAVITGGDRTDIQLAALETSTACLVLTGNLRPSSLILRQADEFGVAVVLVPTNTMETVEAVENIFGKTRLGLPSKLQQFEELIEKHIDLEKLTEMVEIDA